MQKPSGPHEVAPLSAFLGVLGMPGMTAYFGVTDVGALAAGLTRLEPAVRQLLGLPPLEPAPPVEEAPVEPSPTTP